MQDFDLVWIEAKTLQTRSFPSEQSAVDYFRAAQRSEFAQVVESSGRVVLNLAVSQGQLCVHQAT